MFLTTKEYVFFALIFIVLFFFGRASIYIHPKLKDTNINVTFIVIAMFVSLLLILIFKAGKIVNDCPKTGESESFRFEVTPAKLCQGGPYMISSAPKELQDYCQKLWSTPEGQCEYAKVNCIKPEFSGRPLRFLRTPMSNDNWENEMCKKNTQDEYPSVL